MIRRPHKYGARRTVVRGIAFASAAEAARYLELLILARAGTISGLRLQPRYDLTAFSYDRFARDPFAGEVRVAEYVADFEYRENGSLVSEDVKGYDTPVSRLKRKWFAACYGREVRVVRMPTAKRKRAA